MSRTVQDRPWRDPCSARPTGNEIPSDAGASVATPPSGRKLSEEMLARREQLRAERAGARWLLLAGEQWCVYEDEDPYDRRRGPSLVFEGGDVVRRVKRFPENWRELEDEALFALSWRR